MSLRDLSNYFTVDEWSLLNNVNQAKFLSIYAKYGIDGLVKLLEELKSAELGKAVGAIVVQTWVGKGE